MDHLIKLPEHWQFINQFLPSVYAQTPSKMRCGPASTSMAAEIAYPGRWNPVQLEHELYVKWAGPDVASDGNGTKNLAQITDWLHSVGIGFIDLQPLVDEFNNGNHDPLRLELGHMNAQGVPQIMTINDEAYLRQAVPHENTYTSGPILHNWTNPDDPHHDVYSHVIFRVGFSDSDGYGLYAEPAAPAFCQDAHGNFTPVKIMWSDVEKAGIMHCLAIMPHGVATPPAGFSYTTGVWPEPAKPPVNHDAISSTVAALQAANAHRKATLQQELQELDAEDSAFLNILHELGLK